MGPCGGISPNEVVRTQRVFSKLDIAVIKLYFGYLPVLVGGKNLEEDIGPFVKGSIVCWRCKFHGRKKIGTVDGDRQRRGCSGCTRIVECLRCELMGACRRITPDEVMRTR